MILYAVIKGLGVLLLFLLIGILVVDKNNSGE